MALKVVCFAAIAAAVFASPSLALDAQDTYTARRLLQDQNTAGAGGGAGTGGVALAGGAGNSGSGGSATGGDGIFSGLVYGLQNAFTNDPATTDPAAEGTTGGEQNTAGAGGGAATGGTALAGGSNNAASGSSATGGDGLFLANSLDLGFGDAYLLAGTTTDPNQNTFGSGTTPGSQEVNVAAAGGGAATGGTSQAGGSGNSGSTGDATGGDGLAIANALNINAGKRLL